jgi:hypothetical protein
MDFKINFTTKNQNCNKSYTTGFLTTLEKMDCSICACAMENEKALPCGHSFCSVCIARWLVTKPTCPLCRTDCAEFMMDWGSEMSAPLVLQYFIADPDGWTEWLDVEDGPPPLLEESDDEIPLTQPVDYNPTDYNLPNGSPTAVTELPDTMEALEQWIDLHPLSYTFFLEPSQEEVVFEPSQIIEEDDEEDYNNMWRDIAALGELVEA